MSNKWKKRLMSGLIIGSIFCFATGCKQNKKTESGTVQSADVKEMIYESSEYNIEGLKAEIDRVDVQRNKIYLSTHEWTEKDGEEESCMHIYSTDLEGNHLQEVTQLKSQYGQYPMHWSVGKTGEMVINLKVYEEDSDRSYIVKLDSNGKEVLREPVETILGDESGECNGIVFDDQGNIIVAMDSDIYILSEDCKSAEKIRLKEKGDIRGIVLTSDGEVICGTSLFQGDKVITQLHMLDVEKQKWEMLFETSASYLFSIEAGDESADYDIYYSDANGIYGYQLEEKREDKLLDYTESYISEEDRFNIVSLTKDQFLGITEGEFASLVLYQRADPSEKQEKTVITLGALWMDDIVKRQAIEFNKNSENYEIELKEYAQEEDPVAKMNADIMAGNVPDILLLSMLPYEQYVAKGMFEDLTPYFERDEEIDTKDLSDSVLEAITMDGKIYYTSPSFKISTMVARKSDVGEQTGWTFEEMKALINQKEEGVRPFYYESKSDMLYPFMKDGLKDFVDWKAGVSHFDNDNFKNILEVCKSYGGNQKREYTEDDVPDLISLIQDGEILFADGEVDFLGVQQYRKLFGEEITYIGYPNEKKQGTYFVFDAPLAIYSKSKVKEGAWEFLRTFMKKETQGKNAIYLNGTPTRKDCLDLLVQALTTTETYIDEFGQEVYPLDAGNVEAGYGDMIIDYEPLSQEEIDQYMDLINRTHQVSDYNDTIFKIIQEEAEPYFFEEKSLDATIEIIQNRITTYINENR